MKNVYITKISKILPNDPVENEEMEVRLGLVNGKNSRARRIILRNNKIKQRYYAINENGEITHNNTQLTAEAVRRLQDNGFSINHIELLSCGTGSPDQTLPSHAAMVHGELKSNNMEVNTASGACCSGMNALKYAYLSVKSGQTTNAVSTGSERVSTWMKSDIFEEEVSYLDQMEEQPILAFNKEFLRWMLSDGAGAFLLENKQSKKGLSLKIEWMDAYSYAHELETCMYAGAEKMSNGQLKPWSEYPATEWGKLSLFAIKQDVKLLGNNIIKTGVDSLKKTLAKNKINVKDIDYYLPHISSFYFKENLYEEMKAQGLHIPYEKWFMNLNKVGNIGAASIYIMLEELFNSSKLKIGDKILLSVPESARFSYAYAFLTVC